MEINVVNRISADSCTRTSRSLPLVERVAYWHGPTPSAWQVVRL